MITISILGLDQYVAGHYSRDHGKNLASLFEVSEDELSFYSPVSTLFHDGVEQISWNCLVIVHCDAKYEAVEGRVADYILKTMGDFSVNVDLRFDYFHGHEYRKHNPAYPRFLKAENIKEAELAADEAAAEAFDAPSPSEEHPDEAEGIYLGDAFEGKMDALEEKAATDLEAYIKGKGGE